MQAPFRKLITSYAVPCAAICIVAGSVFILGVAQGGYAKDNDARYLYAAAKCWSAGQSPYIAQVFSSKYHAIFGARTASEFFAYPPTVATIALPLSLFSWPVAAKVFSLANFAAAMVLFGACYRLVREELGHALYPSQWFWLVGFEHEWGHHNHLYRSNFSNRVGCCGTRPRRLAMPTSLAHRNRLHDRWY